MKLKFNIKNFGKLSDDEIRIGRLTIFSGYNNTGKSAVSKLIYSLFDGIKTNHTSAKGNSGVSEPAEHEALRYDFKDSLDEPDQAFSNANVASFIHEEIQRKVARNLIQNFQAADFSHLKKKTDEPTIISIDEIGDFEIQGNNTVTFNTDHAGLHRLQDCSKAIYLESSAYWKLKIAQEHAANPPRSLNLAEKEKLNGVPGYFYDLVNALEEEYPGKIPFPEVYEKLKEMMGGKLVISEPTKELRFQENGRDFPLHLTAMGIINLGVIALLIERKVIEEGSFLFINEPEAHLHTTWQVEIAKILFELARKGINIVITTHSIDILKFFEVEIKRHPEDQDLIALNHFGAEGIKSNDDDFDTKLFHMKEELAKPFSNLYIEGILQ